MVAARPVAAAGPSGTGGTTTNSLKSPPTQVVQVAAAPVAAPAIVREVVAVRAVVVQAGLHQARPLVPSRYGYIPRRWRLRPEPLRTTAPEVQAQHQVAAVSGGYASTTAGATPEPGGSGANAKVILTYTSLLPGVSAYSATTICSGQSPAPLGVSAAGGTGAGYTYHQWWTYLTSAGAGTAVSISGETNSTYSPGCPDTEYIILLP